MSWEFNIEVDCPHCGEENYCYVEFDPDSLDQHGGPSYLAESQCANFECDKKFWFKASLTFDLDVDDIFKKKPRK